MTIRSELTAILFSPYNDGIRIASVCKACSAPPDCTYHSFRFGGKIRASEDEGRPIYYFKDREGTRPVYDYELPKIAKALKASAGWLLNHLVYPDSEGQTPSDVSSAS